MTSKQIETRNNGIDLLKLIAMLMVVFLHITNHGQVKSFWGLSANGLLLVFLFSCSMVAVNCFVLISGFYLFDSCFKISKYVRLYIEVLFYSFGGFIFLVLNDYPLALVDYLRCFLPISMNSYWFVTAYLGMYFLSPLLNKLLKSLNVQQHLLLSFSLLLFCSVLRDVLVVTDPYFLNSGYSLLWFIVLYVYGSLLRRGSFIIKASGFLYFLCCILMFSIWLIMTSLSSNIELISRYSLSEYWLRYNSSINIIASVFLFYGFSKIEIRSMSIKKAITWFSSLSLGCYLIHDNYYLRSFIWQNLFRTDLFENEPILVPKVLAVTMTVFFLCLIIDAGRRILFSSFYKCQLWKHMMDKVDKLPQLLSDRLKTCFLKGE